MKPELKEFVKLHVSPIMKESGFKKKGHTWTRIINNIRQMMWIYTSKGNSLSFTIEYGVLVEDAWKIYHGKELPQSIPSYEYIPQCRIGERSASSHGDRWWTFGETPIEEIIEQVPKLIANEVIYNLNLCITVGQIIKFGIEDLKTGPIAVTITMAILYYLNKNYADADRLFSEKLSSFRFLDQDRIDMVEEIKQRLKQLDIEST